MKRRYITKLSTQECKAFFKENVDVLNLSFGGEAIVGWVILNLFSLSYRSGKVRLYNAIFNKLIGRISEKDGNTYVTFRLYKGLTDLPTLLIIFLGSLIILSIKFYDLGLVMLVGLSLLCCLFAGLITFIMTSITEEGEEGRTQLIAFIEQSLELENLNE